ncbi:PspA/IM30 family protein [Sphingomonas sp. ASV193]|uniref:PspA/IM30 family protein n=1 Tax=Sphingomonas sp. ASV193 TaxID=3144405 RepID=UPI0032E8A376
MPDLEPLNDRGTVTVPATVIGRVERIDPAGDIRRAAPSDGRPLAGILSGPIFTRTRDIIAANMTELLDRAEDPARMIRMIIVEMEETLSDVRATAARSIADMKEMRRACDRLDDMQASWADRAQLALERGREDLARQALVEKRKAADLVEGIHAEIAQIETVLKGYEADIQRLQAKLAEARARQQSIAMRMESAMSRAKTSELLNGHRAADAFAKFDLLERRADLAEGMADALGMTGPKSLEEEIAELRAADAVDAELESMKAALGDSAKGGK